MTSDQDIEKFIVPKSTGDFSPAKAFFIAFFLFIITLISFYKEGVTAIPIFVLIVTIGTCIGFVFFPDNGTYMEITPEHVALYKLYRYKNPKLQWMEKFSDNRQLILQEASIPVGESDYREGIKVLVYGKGYQTHTKIAFVKYAPGVRDQVLNMIEKYNLPLTLTKE